VFWFCFIALAESFWIPFRVYCSARGVFRSLFALSPQEEGMLVSIRLLGGLVGLWQREEIWPIVWEEQKAVLIMAIL